MNEIWVLWHMYGDGSAAHVQRAYINKERAEQDYELITSPLSDSGEWHLDKIELIGETLGLEKFCKHCGKSFRAGPGSNRRIDSDFCTKDHQREFNSRKRKTK